MKLYEINAEIMGCIDEETGEIFDIDRFNQLSLEYETKIENICLWIKNLKAEAEALKAEKEVFAARQKAAEKKMESLKKYMEMCLEGTPFESPKVKVTFRKSEAIEVMEWAEIPDEYLKFKEPEINKTELKAALKKGLCIAGVSIVEKNNIQIK